MQPFKWEFYLYIICSVITWKLLTFLTSSWHLNQAHLTTTISNNDSHLRYAMSRSFDLSDYEYNACQIFKNVAVHHIIWIHHTWIFCFSALFDPFPTCSLSNLASPSDRKQPVTGHIQRLKNKVFILKTSSQNIPQMPLNLVSAAACIFRSQALLPVLEIWPTKYQLLYPNITAGWKEKEK